MALTLQNGLYKVEALFSPSKEEVTRKLSHFCPFLPSHLRHRIISMLKFKLHPVALFCEKMQEFYYNYMPTSHCITPDWWLF